MFSNQHSISLEFRIEIPTSYDHANSDQHTSAIDLPNGCRYDGDFIEGKFEGQGKYTFASGASFEGTLEAGQFHGKGSYITPRGDTYTGYFAHNKIEGFGECKLISHPQINSYSGTWINNKPHGNGTMAISSETVYEGEFENGYFHGQGSIRYANGDAYDGIYQRGVPQGDGKFYFKDAKVIMNRKFANGIDRADTSELKESTFEIKRKKEDKAEAPSIIQKTIAESKKRPNIVKNSGNEKIVSSLLKRAPVANTSAKAAKKKLSQKSSSKAKQTKVVRKPKSDPKKANVLKKVESRMVLVASSRQSKPLKSKSSESYKNDYLYVTRTTFSGKSRSRANPLIICKINKQAAKGGFLKTIQMAESFLQGRGKMELS